MAGQRLTKSQIVSELADSTGLAKKDITGVFESLNKLIQKSLGSRGAGEFVIPGLVKLRVRKKPATKDREVVMFGEKKIVKGKPASKSVKATPLKALKDLVLPV